MPIISLASYKGGVSKTTSAIHLATLLDGDNLVIDSDPNRSASTWGKPGLLPFQICGDKEAAKIVSSHRFDWIIIDTPARPTDTEMNELALGCDLLIIPTTPDTLGLDAMAMLTRSLPSDANWRVLLTMVPPRPQKDGEQAMELLKENGFPVFSKGIRFYKAYKEAAAAGTPVNEVRGGGIPWRDWTDLKKEILKAVKIE